MKQTSPKTIRKWGTQFFGVNLDFEKGYLEALTRQLTSPEYIQAYDVTVITARLCAIFIVQMHYSWHLGRHKDSLH